MWTSLSGLGVVGDWLAETRALVVTADENRVHEAEQAAGRRRSDLIFDHRHNAADRACA